MSSAFTARPEIRGTFGVVSSTHWLASQVAMGVLERGGNAFDAAAAGGFALQIVEPHLNGPGGEVPILFWSEDEQRMRALCGQGPAPALATPAYFRSLGLDLVPGIGLLPATVPGAFSAWLTLLRDYGTWELADVLAPAIAYARDGFPLVPRISQAILAVQALFRDEWTSSAEVWLRNGRAPAPDALFRTPGIAATYTRIVEQAQAAGRDRRGRIEAALHIWHEGFVADEIDAYYTHAAVRDTTGQRNRGLLRKSDLAQWRPGYDEPATVQYGRYTVAKCGPWSQGPVHLQQLAILRHLGMDGLDPESPQFVHRIAEAAKLAFADRTAWYGDPAFVEVPLQALLSEPYARTRAALINDTACPDWRPGQPRDGHRACPTWTRQGARWRRPTPGSAWASPPSPPCRPWPNGPNANCSWATPARSTSSTGTATWSPPRPRAAGCRPARWCRRWAFLTTRLQMTWLDDGVPGQLQPGKRPLTTLSPGLALRDGKPYMVYGTPGGDQQDQWTVQFFLRHAAGLNLQEAIEAPSWHVDHFPGSFWPRAFKRNRVTVESRMPAATIEALRQAGHEVVIGPAWSEGRISACTREAAPEGGLLLRAGANPRGMQGYAVGR